MSWLRAKLRNWLLGDILKEMNIAIGVMKNIEQQGLENIQSEMGSMFYSFPGKKVPVKDALRELMQYLGLHLDVENGIDGELYPVLKKPILNPKLKKFLDKSEKQDG